MSATKFNEPLNIGNCFTGVQNAIWEVGKQYDWIYRLELIKANSDYTEFYWISNYGLFDPEYLGSNLVDACKKLDEIHDEEAAADARPELPENVYDFEHEAAIIRGDIPF